MPNLNNQEFIILHDFLTNWWKPVKKEKYFSRSKAFFLKKTLFYEEFVNLGLKQNSL